jgi:hypothetical protein
MLATTKNMADINSIKCYPLACGRDHEIFKALFRNFFWRGRVKSRETHYGRFPGGDFNMGSPENGR